MATSKICKPIKSTLRKAIDYIVNPAKTDGGMLVYSHGCSVKTADLEMALTAKMGTERGDRLAYHMLQSFSPDDDITAEKALELGKEFAQKVTGGKYEFVIATHIDKDHIHNHIIFNSVDYVNHRKYHSDDKDKYRIRDINDEICKANGLSVLPKYDGKRRHKYEDNHKTKKISWVSKLRQEIDRTIQSSNTFDDLLLALEMEGYEIKFGKFISFRAPGQEKFTRLRPKTIGEDYTEEAIRERIANKEKEPVLDTSQQPQNALHKESAASPENKKNSRQSKKNFTSKRINLLLDISKNIKAQQSKGYAQALVRSNINTLVKTMNFLIEHKLTTSEDFQVYADGKKAEYSLYRKDIRKIENELLELSEKIKFTQNYKKNASVYFESKRVKNASAFVREHEDEIVLFKASEMYFERKHINPKDINLGELFEQYKNLKEEKAGLVRQSNSIKKEIKELDTVAANVEQALGVDIPVDDDQQKKQKRERDINKE